LNRDCHLLSCSDIDSQSEPGRACGIAATALVLPDEPRFSGMGKATMGLACEERV